MHNIFLIARREYLERVRSRAFVIMTFFIPALMIGVTVLPSMLARRGSGETKHLSVVAADRETAERVRSRIEQRQDEDRDEDQQQQKAVSKTRNLPPSRFSIEVDTDTSAEHRTALTDKVKQKQLDGFIWATPDAIAAHKISFVTRDISSFIENAGLGQSVSDALRRQALRSKGLSDKDIEDAFQPVKVEAESPMGANAPNPQVQFVVVFAMVMVLYMTVLLYGINVMRAVVEEKTSRIIEVMLSTASSTEMMAGKVLGVGAVGLSQIAIWAIVGGAISGGAVVAVASMIKGVLSVKLLVYFATFFLLGYFLYSTLCAAVGAMVNSEQEAQQLQFLVMMPLIVSVIVIVNVFQHPSSNIAIWGSLFPLTAPLVMFARVAMEPSTPVWQIGLSMALMVATIYGLVLLCSRIYRVGILMYGKKPTLPEIMKWLRYA